MLDIKAILPDSKKKTLLPDNPLKSYISYSTYFIVKLGRNYNKDTSDKAGHEDATLILDSRGGNTDDRKGNESPILTVQMFEINHVFNGDEARISIGLDSTLVIYERGGCTYMHKLGLVLAELGLTSPASALLWVGVGVIGWNYDGTEFVSESITEKWFPHTILDIDMQMRNSGSEYTHWLKGAAYAKSHALLNNQLNIKETVGNTMQDHLDDLMRNANIEMAKAKENNKNGSAPNASFKTITYSYDASTLPISAPVEVNTMSYDTGGVKHISSGGKNGTTTIMTHIEEILKRTPKVLEDLTKNKQQYKIIAQPKKITDTTEEILYKIISYSIDPVGIKSDPLMRLYYFYGGKNEDISAFGFRLDGTFNILAQSVIANTMEDIAPDSSRVTAQIRKNIEAAKVTTMHESIRAEDTAKTAITPQNDNSVIGNEIPPKPRKEHFGNDLNHISSTAWNTYNEAVRATMGAALVNANIILRGNPMLILDDEAVAEYKLETAAPLVIFNIGTPLPEHNDDHAISDAPTETFIYSGNYLINSIKSIFNNNGTFEQEMKMFWISNLDQ